MRNSLSKKLKVNQDGLSLIETLIGLIILVIVSLALFALVDLTLKVFWENKARTIATALATEKIEYLHSLDYTNIGTQGGLPPGQILPSENITRNNIAFNVKTDIFYIDDPFDGEFGSTTPDSVPNDYKRIRISVSWPYRLTNQPALFVTDIAPPGLESFDLFAGVLRLTVFDATGTALPQADVTIVNTSTVPTVNINTQTDANGTVLIISTPTSTQAYQITTSKTGFSTDKTYTADASLPDPDKPHLSVNEGQVTTASFSIDLLANLNLSFQDAATTPIGNLDFVLQGAKTIGLDGGGLPVPKFSQNLQSDSGGAYAASNIEWDTYTVTVATSTGWDISGTDPIQPYNLSPASTTAMTVTLAPTAANSLLVIVEDVDNQPVDQAAVHLFNAVEPYDQTLFTNAAGQAFFTPLLVATSTLEVGKFGYNTSSLQAIINGYTKQNVTLTQP